MSYKEEPTTDTNLTSMKEKLLESMPDDALSTDFVNIALAFMQEPEAHLEALAGVSEFIENINQEAELILVTSSFFRRFSECLSAIPEGFERYLLDLLNSFSLLSSNTVLALSNSTDNIKFLISQMFSQDEEIAMTAIDTIYNFTCTDNREILTNILLANVDINLALLCYKYMETFPPTMIYKTLVKTMMNLAPQATTNSLINNFFPTVDRNFHINDPKILKYSASILAVVGREVGFYPRFVDPSFYSDLFTLVSTNLENVKFVSHILKFLCYRCRREQDIHVIFECSVIGFLIDCFQAVPDWIISWVQCAADIFESIVIRIDEGAHHCNNEFFFKIIQFLFDNGTFSSKCNALSSFFEMLSRLPHEFQKQIVASSEEIIKNCMFGLSSNEDRPCYNALCILRILHDIDIAENEATNYFANTVETNDLTDTIEDITSNNNQEISDMATEILGFIQPEE